MNKILSYLLVGVLVTGAYPVIAATQNDNMDDASDLGTSDTPQHKAQKMRTDKGEIGVNTGATDMDEASDLGTVDTPQHQKQMERTHNKGTSKNTNSKSKNKIMRNKEMNEGTTQGNKLQPTDTQNGTPAPVNP
jgi:hypothetical protein